MKTLFLNPPSFQGFDGGAGSRWQAKREVRSFWYPTWLAQAAALVNDSKLIDATPNELTIEEVVRASAGFELVIVYTSTPSFTNDAHIAELMKQRSSGMLIGFVGPHVSVLPEESLKTAPAVDFVVRKEFDIPILKVSRGERLSEIEGISWRDGNTIRHNSDSEPIDDLDSLPFAIDVYKRDLVIENYFIGYLQHPYVSFYVGRGCPAQCTYCLWPQTFSSHKYRVRSPQSVYEELARAKELFPQVKEFFIDDDTFTANPKRAVETAKLVKKLGITWSTSSRANTDYETMKALKESGLRLLMTGYESGNDNVLRNVKKGITTERMRQFARDCKSLGIAVHGCFMVGLPGETKETVDETLKFACELDPDTIQVSIAAPMPGTEFYQQAIENNWLLAEDLVLQDGTQACPIQYENFSSDEISAARDKLYKRFYFRPKVMLRIGKQMAKDPDVRRRRLREGKEFLSYLSRHKPGNGPANTDDTHGNSSEA